MKMMMLSWLFSSQVAAEVASGMPSLLSKKKKKERAANCHQISFTRVSPRHGLGRDAKTAVDEMLRPKLRWKLYHPGDKDETRVLGAMRHSCAAPHMGATAGWPMMPASEAPTVTRCFG